LLCLSEGHLGPIKYDEPLTAVPLRTGGCLLRGLVGMAKEKSNFLLKYKNKKRVVRMFDCLQVDWEWALVAFKHLVLH
jgi:hypothetical protein